MDSSFIKARKWPFVVGRSLFTKTNSLFFLMFSLVCLLNVGYTLLKSARSALAVADLGGGASAIPWYELCGTMPGAVAMTFLLTFLLNRYTLQRVFFIVLTLFTLFFILFTNVLYPNLSLCQAWISNPALAAKVPFLGSMLFFVMAELWKIALLTVLFWGLVNRYLPIESAKKFYAPLMLGGSVGAILAGPLTTLCTSGWVQTQSWSDALSSIVWMLTLLSMLIGYLFYRLSRSLEKVDSPIERNTEKKEEVLSFWTSIRACCRSKYLLLLAWVTIADYVAYALGEVVFLDVLKQKFPNPKEYCDFMGKLSFYNGFLTAASALFLTPYLLKKCRWVVASLITPLCLLITESAFFFTIWHPALSDKIECIVVLGGLFYCCVRAAKYTLFDTSKEISFILLPPLEKMQGKLVVDGICARLGRGGGSCLSIALIQICGSVLATAPIAGAVALFIAFTCCMATTRLGILVEEKSPKISAEPVSFI